MAKSEHFDVIIIGDGITGLAALRRLWRSGLRRVALSMDPAAPSMSAGAAGWASGGQPDNFTRYSHPLGAERAAAFWRFGSQAFKSLATTCEEFGFPLTLAPRWRMITSMPELTEARQAIAQMQSLGLGGTLAERGDRAVSEPLVTMGERVQALQCDETASSWVDPIALLNAMRTATPPAARLAPVTALHSQRGQPQLTLADGTTATAEMVVVAAHTATRLLIPELQAALVPYADQWTEFHLAQPLPWATSGLGFSANHNNEWGVFVTPSRVRVGGGRYLRPMAGFESTAARAEPRITQHLASQLMSTLGQTTNPVPHASAAGLDIRPCDELPVIGPMFGNGRLLVATGYMGQGLTMGCLAGECLADLIVDGHSAALPRELWPERLRSLST